MLEQVWSNVAGNRFDAKVEKGEVFITIPRGSQMTIYDFSQFVIRLQDALNAKAVFDGKINEEGLTEIRLKFISQPKEQEKGIEHRVEESSQDVEQEMQEPAPKRRRSRRVQVEEPKDEIAPLIEQGTEVSQ